MPTIYNKSLKNEMMIVNGYCPRTIYSEFPDRWIMAEVENTIVPECPYYLLFSVWIRCDGDVSWKNELSVDSFIEDSNCYYFNAPSGAIYECIKDKYGIPNIECYKILKKILSEMGKNAKIIENIGDWNIKNRCNCPMD